MSRVTVTLLTKAAHRQCHQKGPEGSGEWVELYPPRQRGHQKRGEAYDPTMISHGVEISIARGGGKMVRSYLLVIFFFFFL